MKISIIAFSITITVALGAAIPKTEVGKRHEAPSTDISPIEINLDADGAVSYPASIDTSWIDAKGQVKRADSDEAVVYPASVDMSWVDSKDKK